MGIDDLKYVKGVGPVRSEMLAKHFEIRSREDLIYNYPIRHVDKSRYYKIEELREDMPEVQVRGRFVRFATEGEGAGQRLKGIFSDGRRMMETVWFRNIGWFSRNYAVGREYVIFGKPSHYRGVFSMSHPEVAEFREGRMPEGFHGVYSIPDVARKKGITSQWMRGVVENVINSAWFESLQETLPDIVISQYKLMPLKEAVRNMHMPRNAELLQRARERLKFEELFYLELNILIYSRRRNEQIKGYVLPRVGDYFNKYYRECIPFELTGAQKRVIKEIRGDMLTGRQMNRLIQGDVGCGKTMVAFMTLLIGIDNGLQGCLMAPTEILATQHYSTLREWGEAIGLRVELLTGSTRTKERRRIHSGLESGEIHILVGTHALIEENVKFSKLGIAVIDEQHRFGVAQRARLWEKGEIPPHVLVMTATPIPRTLAMTVYGDLDVSVIDELPPGRQPVTTLLYDADKRGEINQLVHRELLKGRQIYFVYPLIKENEKLSLRSLETGYDVVTHTFRDFHVSMVHGQMKPEDKDAEMQKFANHESDIMVATTVIEVGVNVPNASVMVIENAERFGLSQLHQLRGRVGRGAEQSYCLLTCGKSVGHDTRKRLKIMTDTTDGFLVAEADLKLRGPGDMEGTQQSGLPFNLKVSNLATDGQIISIARRMAIKIVDKEVKLSDEDRSVILQQMKSRFSKEKDWSRIS